MMTTQIFDWFGTQDFVPHATCLLWRQDLIQLLAISDGVIAFSYYSIPVGLAYFAHRRTDLAYRWMLYLFAAFIVACGTSHLLDVWTLWYPSYPLEGAVKAVTAAISLVTAILLWRLIPDALALPSPAQLAAVDRQLRLEAEQRLAAVNTVQLAAAACEQAQQQLRTNEARLRAILDTAIEGIIVFDAHGRVENVNPAAARMFGYCGAALVGADVRQLMPHSDLAWRDDDLGPPSAYGNPDAPGTVSETTGIRQDGSEFPLEMALGQFASEQQRHFVGIVRDITRRRQAEGALRDSERRLELALVGSDLGTWDWNILTDDVVFSDRWATMLGYAPEEIRPHYAQWEKLVHPDDLPRVTALLYEHLLGRVSFYEAEHRLATRSGEWLWVLARGTVMERDAAGTPLRASGTHMDISARKQLELRLAEQNEELAHAQRLTTAGEIAAMMAHELNQPLAAITNYLGGAKLRFGPLLRGHPPLEQLIDATLRLSERAADVVASIRDLVRKQEYRPDWVSINHLIDETLQLIYTELHRQRIRLVVDVPTHLPPVWGQVISLKQLFLNLVLNAIEAMRETLRARHVLTLTARSIGSQAIRIDVSDTGAGIAPELAETLFKPFVTTKTGGMGLGLAICRSIVEVHGGQITVESVPGNGATFQVVLPIGRGQFHHAG